MAKATYDYEITDNFICIEDLNQGMSVTNDIETVIDEICWANSITDISDYKVVYMDSEGIWDGFNPKNGSFIHLGALNVKEAINKYKN